MDNLRTCLAFFSALEDDDVERILSLCAHNAAIEFKPLGESFKGTVAGIGKIVWSSFVESFPDLDIEIKDMIWSKDKRKVECRVMVHGTQLYPFVGIINTGHYLNLSHTFHLYFDENARIKSIEVSWDHQEFIHQLSGG